MKIEKILNKLAEDGISTVVVMKANNGYSVVPLSKDFYAEYIHLKRHFNGDNVESALQELLKAQKMAIRNLLTSDPERG